MAETKTFFGIKIDFISQRREIVLFLPSNMATVQTLYNIINSCCLSSGGFFHLHLSDNLMGKNSFISTIKHNIGSKKKNYIENVIAVSRRMPQPSPPRVSSECLSGGSVWARSASQVSLGSSVSQSSLSGLGRGIGCEIAIFKG